MDKIIFVCVLGVILHNTVFAAELPEPSENDPRVRYLTYKKDEVAIINVRRGSVTRIVLGDDEKITVAATGFASDCQKEQLEWCVRADVGSRQVWVKPKDNATFNNLEIQTDRRDYSIEFRVLDDGVPRRSAKVLEGEPMFRVIYRHPVEFATLNNALALQSTALQQASEANLLADRVRSAKPIARNWNYSQEVLKGAEGIAPTLVFDDGRFTYFRFPANREVPTIFYVSPNGEEARINFHMDGDLAVVQRLGRQFVLRLGRSVVGVWNDAFDADGVAAQDGTTIPGVTRTIR